jgi:hypothetical protein
MERLVIIVNRDQIISLRLSIMLKPDKLYNLMIIDSSFTRLESLTLEISKSKELKSLSKLSSLPCLLSLTIYLHDFLDRMNDGYKEIFTIPTLKCANVSFKGTSRLDSLAIATEYDYSLIESLHIAHNSTLDK